MIKSIHKVKIPSAGRTYRQFLDLLPRDAFDRNNAIGTFLMGALPALAGSAITFLLNAFFIWAILSLIGRRFRFQMTSDDRMLAIVLSLYALSIVGTALIAVRHVGLIESTLWVVPYFSAWVLIPRLRASPNLDYLFIFCFGAAFGAISACLLGSAQLIFGQMRPEAGSGNPAVYSVMCLLLAVFAALNILDNRPIVRKLAVAGAVAGLFAMLISQTRGTWIAALPALAIIYVYAPDKWSGLLKGVNLYWVLGASFFILLIFGHFLIDRILYTQDEIDAIIIKNNYGLSIGERLKLWQSSLAAITESPIIGFGIQNRMLVIQPYYVLFESELAKFTHAHNFILTAMLDGGVIVVIFLFAMLIAPVTIACNSGRIGQGNKNFYFSILLILIYSMNGLTQIMFKHDIMDSFFIYSIIIFSVSSDFG